MKAILLAKIDVGKEHDIKQEANALEFVTDSLITYGEWDLVLVIETDSVKQLDLTITTIRKQIGGINETVTLIGAE